MKTKLFVAILFLELASIAFVAILSSLLIFENILQNGHNFNVATSTIFCIMFNIAFSILIAFMARKMARKIFLKKLGACNENSHWYVFLIAEVKNITCYFFPIVAAVVFSSIGTIYWLIFFVN